MRNIRFAWHGDVYNTTSVVGIVAQRRRLAVHGHWQGVVEIGNPRITYCTYETTAMVETKLAVMLQAEPD